MGSLPMYTLLLLATLLSVQGLQPIWRSEIDQTHNFFLVRTSVYKDTQISVKVLCRSENKNTTITVRWTLAQLKCWRRMDKKDEQVAVLELARLHDHQDEGVFNDSSTEVVAFQTQGWRSLRSYQCDSEKQIILKNEKFLPYDVITKTENGRVQLSSVNTTQETDASRLHETPTLTRTWATGVYIFLVNVWPEVHNTKLEINQTIDYKATVRVRFYNRGGFLAPLDWPKLPASGVLAFVYLIMCSVWTYLWMKAQLHTSKIHVIIGCITLGGAIIHTITFVQKSSENSHGYSFSAVDVSFEFLSLVQSLLVLALLLSVSYGYGLTKFTIEKCFKVTIGVMCSLLLIFGMARLVLEHCNGDLQIVKTLQALARTLFFITFIVTILIIFVTGVFTLCHIRSRKHNDKTFVFGILMLTVLIQFIIEVVIFSIFWLNFSTIFLGCSDLWRYQWIAPYSVDVQLCVLMTVLMVLWRPIDVAQSYAFFPVNSEETNELEDDEQEIMDENEKSLGSL